MRGLSFTIAGALYDNLVTAVGQTIQSTVSQDGVVKQAEPFIDCPVTGDDKARVAVSGDYQLIKVGGLLRGKLLESKIIDDEQIRVKERA